MIAALVLTLAGSASALLVSPLAAHAPLQRVAASPLMACNGGKGGSGGEGPPLDKMRKGRLNALVQAADDADKVKSILLSSQTEGLLLSHRNRAFESSIPPHVCLRRCGSLHLVPQR